MTFNQLISSYKNHSRAYQLLFALSSQVKNISDYISKKQQPIDFPLETFESLFNSTTPIERITKEVSFCGETFYLHDQVFCPRHETELLAEELNKYKNETGRYIDICSGTGVIGITFLKNNKNIEGTLLDISEFAIDNIHRNLERHNIQATVIHSDWLEYLNQNNDYQIISTNFPYVGRNDPIQDLDHDPELALFADQDGWEHYGKLLEWMKRNNTWKVIALELNPFHQEIWEQIREEGWNIRLIKDMRDLLRIAIITR